MHISDIYLDKFVKKISTLIFSIIHIKLSNLMRERMEAKKLLIIQVKIWLIRSGIPGKILPRTIS